MSMKEGIRILAVDDSRIRPGAGNVLVVGVVGRKGVIEGVLSCRVTADGSDSTGEIERMASSSRFMEQVRLIAINGTTVAGLNVVDIAKISSDLGVPVIAVTRKRPHPSMLIKSIMSSRAAGRAEKASIIRKISSAAKIHKMRGFYVQGVGIERDLIVKRIEDSVGLLRLAHIIASGVSGGESKGRM